MAVELEALEVSAKEVVMAAACEALRNRLRCGRDGPSQPCRVRNHRKSRRGRAHPTGDRFPVRRQVCHCPGHRGDGRFHRVRRCDRCPRDRRSDLLSSRREARPLACFRLCSERSKLSRVVHSRLSRTGSSRPAGRPLSTPPRPQSVSSPPSLPVRAEDATCQRLQAPVQRCEARYVLVHEAADL